MHRAARIESQSKLNKDSSVFNCECEAGGAGCFLQRCIQHDDGVRAYVDSAHEAFSLFCAGGQNDLESGANIIGSCCGSTPDHIRAFRKVMDEFLDSKEINRMGGLRES